MPAFSRTNLHIITLYTALAAVLFFSFNHQAPQPHSKEFTALPAITAVASVPVEVIAVPHVVVLRKADVAKKIKLPPAIAVDPAKQITATGAVPSAPYGAEVISVIDTGTGESAISSRIIPRPVLSFNQDRRIGLGYGFGVFGEPVGKLYAEMTFARIGSVHVGVQGVLQHSTYQGPSATAFITMDYRF